MAAINHGADAVYIGPSQFGARVAAGNSVEDIAQLVEYAHKYYARVYVTLNTILRDEELEQARRLVNDLYNVGVDALIVQDMALLQMDLPPIALHASTQCDTRTVEKVKFLEQCGFEQVVLARETTLDTMRQMAEHTNVALEAFGKRLAKANRLCRDSVHKRAALRSREDRLIYLLCNLLVISQNKTAARASERLVSGTRDHVGVRQGRRMLACGNKACDMRHIHHKIRSHGVRDLCHFLKINNSRIRRRARNYKLWLMFKRHFINKPIKLIGSFFIFFK